MESSADFSYSGGVEFDPRKWSRNCWIVVVILVLVIILVAYYAGYLSMGEGFNDRLYTPEYFNPRLYTGVAGPESMSGPVLYTDVLGQPEGFNPRLYTGVAGPESMSGPALYTDVLGQPEGFDSGLYSDSDVRNFTPSLYTDVNGKPETYVSGPNRKLYEMDLGQESMSGGIPPMTGDRYDFYGEREFAVMKQLDERPRIGLKSVFKSL